MHPTWAGGHRISSFWRLTHHAQWVAIIPRPSCSKSWPSRKPKTQLLNLYGASCPKVQTDLHRREAHTEPVTWHALVLLCLTQQPDRWQPHSPSEAASQMLTHSVNGHPGPADRCPLRWPQPLERYIAGQLAKPVRVIS